MGNFGAKYQHFLIFLFICSSDFTEIAVMTGIKKWFKITLSDFSEKLSLCPEWCRWDIFGPKTIILGLLSKSVH